MSIGQVIFDDASAAAALAHCREITRRCARNFYYGLKLSPEPQRSALYVIYAWMRRADDLVDAGNSHDAAEIGRKLDEFRAATDVALAGRPTSNDPLWIGLAAIAKQFRLPAECFHAMLEGQRDDVDRKAYETFEQLREYCYRVASTVGLLCVEVWGYSDARARDMAVDRGIAFQLTNILRDFAEDFDAGRVYLPSSELSGAGLTAEQVRRWTPSEECRAFMSKQIERCEEFYRRSSGLEELINQDCRPTLWAMTSIYHNLLLKMSQDPARIVAPTRLRLSSLQKGLIAFRARWQARSTTPSGSGHILAPSRASRD